MMAMTPPAASMVVGIYGGGERGRGKRREGREVGPMCSCGVTGIFVGKYDGVAWFQFL